MTFEQNHSSNNQNENSASLSGEDGNDAVAAAPKTSIDDMAALQAEDMALDDNLKRLSADERTNLANMLLTRRFLSAAKGFWFGDSDRLAWLLSGTLLLFILGTIGAQYGINLWNRYLFDALEKRDAGTVVWLSAVFFPLAGVAVGFGIVNVYTRMTLQRRWRAWLSDHLLSKWFHKGRYYQLNLVSGDHDNPEQRMTDDLRIATEAPIDFFHGLVTATLSALTFITVLWTLGGAATFHVGGMEFYIPGFLVLAAIAYAFITTVLMMWIGRRFTPASEAKNHAEATYRYHLARVREHGESIALLGGEQEERAGLDRSFMDVLLRWRTMCRQHMRTSGVAQISDIIAPVIPLVIAAPKYLSGAMTLGEVMQAASAFAIVQNAFGWLVDNFPRLADWRASARRVASLIVSLDGLEEAENDEGAGRITRNEAEGYALSLKELSVTLDDGTVVVDDTDVYIKSGERVLVAGESGTGKSTLVRAIAGLWPWGGGVVTLLKGASLLLLPQRPYVPVGTLRRAVTYPGATADFTNEQVAQALELVGLGHVKDRLDEGENWDHTLSGGEKQRLTVARVLLHKPDIIVMDEATSALDSQSQEHVMQTLIDKMPDLTILSVGHRPELEKFHSRKLVLERRAQGAKMVKDVVLSFRAKEKGLLERYFDTIKRSRRS